MAFYNKTDDLSRDPTAIGERARGGSGILSTVIVLLIIAAAFGLYFMYAGSGPIQPSMIPPVTENAPAPTPEPATQPPAQTTPQLRTGVVAASLLARRCRDCFGVVYLIALSIPALKSPSSRD